MKDIKSMILTMLTVLLALPASAETILGTLSLTPEQRNHGVPPAAPYDIEFFNNEWGKYVWFQLPDVDIDGTILSVDSLYYEIFVNGSLQSFDITDEDQDVQTISLIPYLFSDWYNIWVGTEDTRDHTVYLNDYIEISNIGIRSVYVNENGNNVYSEMSYWGEINSNDFEYEGLWYTVLDENAHTCKTKDGIVENQSGNNCEGEVIIPATVSDGLNDYTVVEIGQFSFYGCPELTSITIPDGVTSIGYGAFEYCTGLTSINIPDGVTAIYDSTFYGCSSLTSINIPEGVTGIGQSAFYGCSSLTSITIPEGVTGIGVSAFYGCSSLTSINIPEGVTWIGVSAFYGCSSLTSINIPEGVTMIGQSAFYGCSSLTSINIPEGVTGIGQSTFEGCSSLTSINIPEGVTLIGPVAFHYCSNLTSIIIPESVTSIGQLAFDGIAPHSEIIYLAENPVEASEYTFSYDSYSFGILKTPNATLADVQATVPWKMFAHIQASDGSVGFEAAEGEEFEYEGIWYTVVDAEAKTVKTKDGYYDRPNDIDVPGNIISGDFVLPSTVMHGNTEYTVVQIGQCAFSNNQGLTSVVIPESVTTIGLDAFSICSNLMSVILPEHLSIIETGLFVDCSSLESITIPASVTAIKDIAFRECINLRQINIPEGVTSIGAQAFYLCASLPSITLPSSLQSIDRLAFDACSPEIEIIYMADNPIEANDNIFNTDIYQSGTLIMPNATLADVQATVPWNMFAHIQARDGSVGFEAAEGDEFEYEGIRYQVVDAAARTVKTMPIYEEVDSVWVSGYHFNGELAIPARASDGMNEYTVVGVGESSFSGCSEVTSVSLPNTLTFIENRGFDGCSGLTSIDLPSSVEEIGMYFLSSCTALTEITIPEKVTTIKWGAFNGCTSLSEVRLPEGLEEIETNAFIACYNLTAITLPDSLKRIGGAAFAACGLTSIELPSGLEYLGNIAFRGDPLESVTIPASLLEADETPFQYCGYIGEVTYLAERPVAFDEGFFENTVYENATLNTPNATIADIQATVPWNKFARIQARDGSVGFVEAGTEFEYDGIVYTVLDPDASTCKVKDARNAGQTDVSISEEVIYENRGYTVVEIGDESFAGLASMYALQLPSTIERVGEGAFEGCERLTSLLWRGSRRMPYELVEAVGNPNLLVYVDRAEYAPEGMDHNVVAEGVCEKLELTPGYAFYPYGEFVANSSRMTKEFTQQTAYDGCAGWETIVLPFDVTRVTSPNGSTLLPFAAVSDTRRQRPFWLYEAYEEGEWMEAASIRAGIPYNISMPNNPRYNPAYNVNGTVTFSNPNPQTISREITVPYGVTWNTGHQFLSIWTPLSDAEAAEAMGLNANMDTVRDDSGRLLAPGSAFCRGITPKPLEAYVTVSDQSRIFPIRGLQTAVLSLEDEDGLTVVQDGGGVVLKSSEDRTVEIYSADGTLLRRIALKAGEAVSIDGLPQGVCLIAGRKVMIR